MKRSVPDNTHESTDRWLLTYADMITLLMAFFIMMYSMSILNLAKFRQAAISIRSGFGGAVRGQGQAALRTGGVIVSNSPPMADDTGGSSWKVLRPLLSYIEDHAGKENRDMRIYQDERGIVIAVRSDALLFESGRAALRMEAYPLLNKIAETLIDLDGPVQVEGHTCVIPPSGREFRSNWELSTARATNIIRYLVGKGIAPQRLSASGYSCFRPIAPNDTAAGRAMNRRVEIVIPQGPRIAIQKDMTKEGEASASQQ